MRKGDVTVHSLFFYINTKKNTAFNHLKDTHLL